MVIGPDPVPFDDECLAKSDEDSGRFCGSRGTQTLVETTEGLFLFVGRQTYARRPTTEAVRKGLLCDVVSHMHGLYGVPVTGRALRAEQRRGG